MFTLFLFLYHALTSHKLHTANCTEDKKQQERGLRVYKFRKVNQNEKEIKYLEIKYNEIKCYKIK